MRLIRFALALGCFLFGAAEARAQRVPAGARVEAQELTIPASAWLQWEKFSMLMVPEAAGVRWRVTVPSDSKRAPEFTGFFNPALAQVWVGDAKTFLSRELSDADTGSVTISPVLMSLNGDGVYLARRKSNGAWSKDRFLVTERGDNGEFLVATGDQKTMSAILDTLVAVSRRTDYVPDSTASPRDSLERLEPQAIWASANPTNHPPMYPVDERRANREGRVLLSFVVGTDGRVEMASMKVLYATNRAFLTSVVQALEPMRFSPAELQGAPVRQRVTMPFLFSIVR